MSITLDDDLVFDLATPFGLWLGALTIPGPNFILTAHIAATRSLPEGLATATGIGLGTGLWAIVVLLGLGAIMHEPLVLHLARLAGAIYFVGLGFRILRQRGTKPEPAAPLQGGIGKSLRRGMMSELLSIHRLPFLASLFALSLPAREVPAWFMVMMLLTTMLTAMAWYAIVAVMAAGGPWARSGRGQRMLARLGGAALILLGLNLARIA